MCHCGGWGGRWLAASSGRAPRPSQCSACLPFRGVGRRRAPVESEGWVLEGQGSPLRQGWEPTSQEACKPSWGMVLEVLPSGWAQRIFQGTSVCTRQCCYFVPCGKLGWLSSRTDFWLFPELCEAIHSTPWGLEVILWPVLPFTLVMKFVFL